MKPVAWMSQGGDVSRSADYFEEMGFKDLIPLYTHPAELTDEEILDAIKKSDFPLAELSESAVRGMTNFARAILRKASEK